MPIFVDGVEISAVFVDGVEQANVFADGVEVFTSFEGEDYLDNFTTDPNGTLISNHLMNTGQPWQVDVQDPVSAVIANGVGAAAGFKVAAVGGGANGTKTIQIVPLPTIINSSFVCECNYGWTPNVGSSVALSAELQILGGNQTSAGVLSSGGASSWSLSINGTRVDEGTFTALNATGMRIIIYFSGTEIAAEYFSLPTLERVVVPQQAALGVPNIGREFRSSFFPVPFTNPTVDLFNISEVAVSPSAMPWPT